MLRVFPFAALAIHVLTSLCHAEEPKVLSPKDAKAAFLKLLDRPKVKLDVQEEKAVVEKDKYVVQKLSFASEKKDDGTVERVPVLVVRPIPPAGVEVPKACMICLHGTGGTKEGMRKWLNDFADAGMVAIAIDARYHGARAGGEKGSAAYVAAITKAWKTPKGEKHEHPWFYDTCWDLWRLLDYIETRGDVNKKRIGMTGTSMGGIQTYLAGSCDERVAVAAPLIGVQSFKYGLDNDKWQARMRTVQAAHNAAAKDLGEAEVNQKVCRALWGKLLPGIDSDFDGPNMIRLFAGRPLFIGNGELDPNCPLEGAKLAFKAAEEAFEAAKAKDKLVVHVEKDVPHKVTDTMHKAAVEFCVKWLTAKE